MPRRSLLLFASVAALWGVPYALIRVALHGFSPAAVAGLRTAVAALVLMPFAVRAGGLASLRGRFGLLAVFALLQMAGPFLLIAAGEQRIPSGLAGVLVAAAPIAVALLSIWLVPEERLGSRRLIGLGGGIVGVALLLGLGAPHGTRGLVGCALVLGAPIGYACAAILQRRRLAGVRPQVLTAAVATLATAWLLVPAILTQPAATPSWRAVVAVVVLGIGPTAAAFALFTALNAEVGPGRASVVAYVAPAFAVAIGAAFLHERVGAATIAGLALVLAGSRLATMRRRPAAPPATAVDEA